MKTPFVVTIVYLGYLQAALLTDLCTSPVYCQGHLLDVIQRARLLNDSKSFVDLIQKHPENQTVQNFNTLMRTTNNTPTKQELTQFINDNFLFESELTNWTPDDLQENPKFFDTISDPSVRDFAVFLNSIWPMLARKVKDEVSLKPDQHSILALPNGFIIPGGRFREIYYWDSYWIVKGLLLCDMNDTAKGILANFIHLVKTYGFVPNGNRVYYLNRSQPPLLTMMVKLYVDATNDLDFLIQHIDALEIELNWWLENRLVRILKDKKLYSLAQYAVKSDTPRPESYAEDITTCNSMKNNEKARCYRNLKSAAESGWDFSSRWFTKDGNVGVNLTDIFTRNIVPVDLNAFLCASFGILSKFYALIGNPLLASKYGIMEKTWITAIESVLYSYCDGIWYDWDIISRKHRAAFYPSNFAPLWTESYDATMKNWYGGRAARYFKRNNLDVFAGGIPTSLLRSGQQWDLPNAWPPLQEIVILGLKSTGNKNAQSIANTFGKRVVQAFMVGVGNTGEMFEKYDATRVGEYGGGGEYPTQSGFGWSNGVALSLINIFYTK